MLSLSLLLGLGSAVGQHCESRLDPGLHTVRLETGEAPPNHVRSFLAAIPSNPPDGLLPGIVDFHGFSESPHYQALLVNASAMGEEYKWVFAIPYGTAQEHTESCCPRDCDEECCTTGQGLDKQNPCAFNAGSCCGGSNVDDVVFTRLIVKYMVDNLCVSADNVFAMGFSNGGMMSNRVACEATDIFKGVAPSAGNLAIGGGFPGCSPSRSVSWLSFCGRRDSVCNIGQQITFNAWGQRNGCDTSHAVDTFVTDTTTCTMYEGCRDDVIVENCWIDNLGHEYSGHERPFPDGPTPAPPQPDTNVDATRYLMDRFSTLLDLPSWSAFWANATATERS